MTTEEITKLNNLISMVAMCITDLDRDSVSEYLDKTLDEYPKEVIEHCKTVILSVKYDIEKGIRDEVFNRCILIRH